MFKILVTTTYHTGNGAAVHTLVIEYPSPELADRACNRINEGKQTAHHEQVALALYKR